MIKRAFLKSISECVEGEVVLVFDGIEVTCFSVFCPYDIKVGKTYLVELDMYINDEYKIEEEQFINKKIERVGNTFCYKLYGKLLKGAIDCGIIFYDEYLLSEFGHLEGKNICL